MKQTTIVGNIGRDAVCREGDGGHKFVSFSVAYGERKTGETDEQGNRSMADIRFGPADYGGMSGRRSDFSQGQKH